MASVEWKPEGLDSLVRHDSWRFSQGWEPIALELMDAVEAYFRSHDPAQPPRFIPGSPEGWHNNPETSARPAAISWVGPTLVVTLRRR